MTDTLGWRMKLGVLVPSTNTTVQPEYDAMRPPGVTNHVRGFLLRNVPTRTDAEYEQQLENMRATQVDAMDEVLTLEPDHVILATAAESAGGVAGASLLRERLVAKSGGRVGVTLGADAILAALHRFAGSGVLAWSRLTCLRARRRRRGSYPIPASRWSASKGSDAAAPC